MKVQNIIVGYTTPRRDTPSGEACWVTHIGRPPKVVVPDATTQRRWRLASVREARRMQDPWKDVDPGTRRTAKGTFLRLVDTSTALVRRADGEVRRYPLDRVAVQGRFKLHDFGEHDMWTTLSFGKP